MPQVVCSCGQTLAVKPELVGRNIACPKCNRTMVVTAPKKLQATVFCDWCHQDIPKAQYDAHVQQHLAQRSDGQHNEYATLPPAHRNTAAAQRAPTNYRHRKCQTVTVMPDEIVATYLENPWFYLADKTFCCGCGTHVKNRECTWEATNENLQVYFDRLRAGKPEYRPGLATRCFAKILSIF